MLSKPAFLNRLDLSRKRDQKSWKQEQKYLI